MSWGFFIPAIWKKLAFIGPSGVFLGEKKIPPDHHSNILYIGAHMIA